MAVRFFSSMAFARRCAPSSEFRRFSLSSCHSRWLPSTQQRGYHRDGSDNEEEQQQQQQAVAVEEARRLLRLVNVEAMKTRLESDRQECMSYADLLRLCQTMSVASSQNDAEAFAKTLDEAGVVFIFRGKVFLHPQQVAMLVANAVPLSFTSEDDPRRLEVERMRKEKEEIDKIAHKQVRVYLWSGLVFLLLQTGFFVRLTFWELSWDVMEPVAFFVTSVGLISGYAYFLFTSRDPTYQDLMTWLFTRRQRKLMHIRKFDMQRLSELEKQCQADLKRLSLRSSFGIAGSESY